MRDRCASVGTSSTRAPTVSAVSHLGGRHANNGNDKRVIGILIHETELQKYIYALVEKYNDNRDII